MAFNEETVRLIADSANKIFGDLVDKAALDAAEQGNFADALWATVVANGFHQIGSEGSGTSEQDMYAFLKVCGAHAVPLPIADTLLANVWLGATDGISSVGVLQGDEVTDAVWASAAQRIVGISRDKAALQVATEWEVVETRANLAGEPVATVRLHNPETAELSDDPYAQMALAATNLMAGCLQTQLNLGIQFATERLQFGRSISKFQAIQHSLAVVAAEVAAAQRAADSAADALGTDRFVAEVAASKARVGEAVGVVAEQVHQVHGAMGFTHEHQLHHYSRRTWAWRDTWGQEFYWQIRLGQHIANLGADKAWDFIATRS